MRNKVNELELIANEKNADIIVLSETWLYPEEVPYINIPNYKGHYQCRKNGRGGGIAVLTNKDYKANQLLAETEINCETTLVEILNTSPKIKILAIYKPPQVEFATFLDYLDKIMQKEKKCHSSR